MQTVNLTDFELKPAYLRLRTFLLVLKLGNLIIDILKLGFQVIRSLDCCIQFILRGAEISANAIELFSSSSASDLLPKMVGTVLPPDRIPGDE